MLHFYTIYLYLLPRGIWVTSSEDGRWEERYETRRRVEVAVVVKDAEDDKRCVLKYNPHPLTLWEVGLKSSSGMM